MIAIGVFIPLKIPGPHALVIWLIIMMVYSYIASTLPVQTLLQPRDYINSHELLVAMGLVGIGAIAALIRAPSHLAYVAPMVNSAPKGAPPMWPFLFVTIACGAISGFHSLVASGTSSKQVDKETDALLVGYGGMIGEGILASLAILAVAAGIGAAAGSRAEGIALWNTHYASWQVAKGLGAKIGAFVQGSVNMMSYVFGTSKYMKALMTTIMGVFIVSFASTSLDTATRAQRYVIQEFGRTLNWKWLQRRHPATLVAVLSAFALAMSKPSGKGALILWPLFGTVNQLLAGLALLVATVYLIRKKAPFVVTLIPMIFMIIMTGWAMWKNIVNFHKVHNWLLFIVGIAVFILMIWLVIEAIVAVSRQKRS